MKTIRINNVEHPINFGLKAINEFSKRTGVKFGDILSATTQLSEIELIVVVTTLGLNDGSRKSKRDRRFTEDEVWDYFEDAPELIGQCSEIFAESLSVNLGKLGVDDESKNVEATQE